MASPRPFHFAEFGATREKPASPAERVITAAELEAARAEGIIEGRRLAMESIAADESAQLARIAEALESAVTDIETANAEARDEAMALAGAFAEEFAVGLAARREIEAAEDLLRRLTENSEDRRAASLFIAAKSLPRLRARLETIIKARALGDFVTLESDAALNAGEIRLDWRGGGVKRGRAEIKAALSAVFETIGDDCREASDERS